MIPAYRNVFLPVFIGILLLSLSVAPGCCKRCCGTGGKPAQADNAINTGSAGVAITKEVPHSKETIPEIRDREMGNPPPARMDTAIHPHGIPPGGNDNGVRTE